MDGLTLIEAVKWYVVITLAGVTADIVVPKVIDWFKKLQKPP